MLPPLLAHPERPLRQTAGSCISTIIKQCNLSSWPELVSALQACLSTQDTNALSGALDALFKVRLVSARTIADALLHTVTSRKGVPLRVPSQIVEESPVQLEQELARRGQDGPTTASCVLVPPLLKLLQVQSPEIRRQAAACLNLMAREMPPGIHDNLDP